MRSHVALERVTADPFPRSGKWVVSSLSDPPKSNSPLFSRCFAPVALFRLFPGSSEPFKCVLIRKKTNWIQLLTNKRRIILARSLFLWPRRKKRNLIPARVLSLFVFVFFLPRRSRSLFYYPLQSVLARPVCNGESWRWYCL